MDLMNSGLLDNAAFSAFFFCCENAHFAGKTIIVIFDALPLAGTHIKILLSGV